MSLPHQSSTRSASMYWSGSNSTNAKGPLPGTGASIHGWVSSVERSAVSRMCLGMIGLVRASRWSQM